MVVLLKNIVSIPLKVITNNGLIFKLFKRMIKNYKVTEILEAVADIAQPMQKKKEFVQKEVNRKAEEFSSSEAAAFEIDEIQKITPKPKEKIEQNDKFAMEEKSSNAIPPDTEKLIIKAEKSLEINKSEKKDNPLVLTNLYEIADKPEKDKASKILETQNDTLKKKSFFKKIFNK